MLSSIGQICWLMTKTKEPNCTIYNFENTKIEPSSFTSIISNFYAMFVDYFPQYLQYLWLITLLIRYLMTSMFHFYLFYTNDNVCTKLLHHLYLYENLCLLDLELKVIILSLETIFNYIILNTLYLLHNLETFHIGTKIFERRNGERSVD